MQGHQQKQETAFHNCHFVTGQRAGTWDDQNDVGYIETILGLQKQAWTT